MEDILLKEFFSPARWEAAINTGIDKHIDKGELRKLTTPEVRLALYRAIRDDNYLIAPPHQAQIPKDDGTMRTVYVNENIDRVFLSIANNLFMDMFHDFIHKQCKSYQTGIGCGKIAKEVSRQTVSFLGDEVGVKLDLSKYFDSVPIQYIDNIFDKMECKCGRSKIIDVIRAYYHTNLCFDIDGELIEQYQSLKQGCAVASFLADAVLYHLDDTISKMKVYYVRYSDDILILGSEWKKALLRVEGMLTSMGMKLNPKKVEVIRKDKWFKFLGFNIKGEQITLSKGRVKSFQKEIESRTIKQQNTTKTNALNKVNAYLYKGDGEHSWATGVLPIINVEKDIDELNKFVLDCIRAVETGKKKIGGLGSVNDLPDRTILRGTGKNVAANRAKTGKEVDDYYTIACMRRVILTDKGAYEAIVRMM